MDEGRSKGKSLNEVRCEEAEVRIANILKELKLPRIISPQDIQCIAVEYRKQIQLKFLPESEEREWIETFGLVVCSLKP